MQTYYKDYSNDINAIVHETGLSLVFQGKLKGKDVIDFIKSDKFYINDTYNQNYQRPLDILNTIDVSSIDEAFLEEWLKMDWYAIFRSQYESFLLKTCSFIKNINNFHIS